MPAYVPTTLAEARETIDNYIKDNTTNLISPSKMRAILQTVLDYFATALAAAGVTPQSLQDVVNINNTITSNGIVADYIMSSAHWKSVFEGGRIYFSKGSHTNMIIGNGNGFGDTSFISMGNEASAGRTTIKPQGSLSASNTVILPASDGIIALVGQTTLQLVADSGNISTTAIAIGSVITGILTTMSNQSFTIIKDSLLKAQLVCETNAGKVRLVPNGPHSTTIEAGFPVVTECQLITPDYACTIAGMPDTCRAFKLTFKADGSSSYIFTIPGYDYAPFSIVATQNLSAPSALWTNIIDPTHIEIGYGGALPPTGDDVSIDVHIHR